MSTAAKPGITVRRQWRDPIVSTFMLVATILIAWGSHGESNLSFANATSWFEMGIWTVPAALTNWLMVAVALGGTAAIWVRAVNRKSVSGYLLVLVGVALVVAFLVWCVCDRPTMRLPVVSLLSGGLMFATPLVFGALSGIVCERSGIINIAIEGQMLCGAFAGIVTASTFSNPWMGLIGAPIAGVLISLLLGLFTIKFRTDNIVVGVVLNTLALGVTSFLFSTLLSDNPALNKPNGLPSIRIPILADIPIIGPVMFNQTILVYAMYVAAILLQFMVFNSKWGLRMRACGEKPQAADTVGINVNRIRWQNVILGGVLAGLGGAFFTIGQSLTFSKDMAAGYGYIALAAMILGRWNPQGAVAASLLFGFATNLSAVMQAVGAAIPSEVLLMIPYLVTILAVAGFVGAVRAPAAEGVPYP